MMGRWTSRKREEEAEGLKSFDDYEFRLGDAMRGERATMGKSLLDVQRELKIKASYIDAIENADLAAFESPGFIPGYVRSYARYLNMDPDKTFADFCAESGFKVAALKAEAFGATKTAGAKVARTGSNRDVKFSNISYMPQSDSWLSRIEPGAIGSVFVLALLIGGIGFGGWAVLQEVQRVTLAPAEQIPVVLSDLDPIDSSTDGNATTQIADLRKDGLDRLYRPKALDAPVLVSRDGPISTLDPNSIGVFAAMDAPVAQPLVGSDQDLAALATPATPQVLETAHEGISIFAVKPAWMRVRAADGSVIYENTLNAGEQIALPNLEDAPNLQTGMSGYVYFRVNGQVYGPVGSGTRTARNVDISTAAIEERFVLADLTQDAELANVVASLEIPAADEAEQPAE